MTVLYALGMLVGIVSGCILGRAIAEGQRFVGVCAVVGMLAGVAVVVLASIA